MKFGGVGQKTSRAAVEPGGDHLVPVKFDRKEPSGPVSCPSSTVWTRTSETPHSSSLVFTQNQGEVQEFLLFSAAGWTVRRCCSVGGQNLLTLLPPAETLKAELFLENTLWVCVLSRTATLNSLTLQETTLLLFPVLQL